MFRRSYKWIGAVLAVFVLLFSVSLAVPAIAGETRGGRYVTVGVDEIIPDDLYCTGDTITIDGTVQGDLVATGNEIYVNGTVEGDLIAAGKTIVIHGTVRDDARIAGFEVEIAKGGLVGDDLNAAAFSVALRPGGEIGGDAYVLARQMDVGGRLSGKLVGLMDALRISGAVAGDVTVEVSPPDEGIDQMGPLAQMFPIQLLASGLHVTDSAQIMGKLAYTSSAMGDISPDARVSEEIYQTPVPEKTPVATPSGAEGAGERGARAAGAASVVLAVLWWILGIIRRFITLVVIALLLVWLLPVFPQAAAKLKERPWPSLGWGCLVEIVFFVAMPIIFIAIIAISLLLGVLTLGGLQGYFAAIALLLQGLAAAIFGVITSYVTKIVVAYLVGAWLLAQVNRKSARTHMIWPTLLGILIYVIVRAIPVLGWLVDLAVTLLGLGALWLWAREQCPWWPTHPKPAPALAAGPTAPAAPAPVQQQSPPAGPAAIESVTATVIGVVKETPADSDAGADGSEASADSSGDVE